MNISAVFALGLLLQSPLPRPVATLTITTGSVKIERKVGVPPKSDSKIIRLRNGDRVTVVEKGRMTVILDKTGATWRLPDSGQFQAKDGVFQGLHGAKAQLVQQGKTVTRRPLAPSTVITDKIRAGQVKLEPFGGIEQGPVVVKWTKVPGAGKTWVEILDAKDRVLGRFDPIKGVSQVTLPAGVPKPGTWARIRVSQPDTTSTWVYVLTNEEQTEVSAAERELRTTLKEDPQALGLALGNLWAEFRLASKLPTALKMAFEDPATGDAQWRFGEWLEQAGFPALARTAYEAAWKAGERDGLLKESIERLGGKAEVPEWEKAAGERDQLIAAGKLKEALPVAERVVALLREGKPESLELALALRTIADMQADLKMYPESDKNFGEAIALFQRLKMAESLEAALAWDLWAYSSESRGYLELAQKRYEAALAIRKKLAPGSLDVANILFNLGLLAVTRGDLDLAQKLYEAALDIREKLAPNSLRMAGILNNLGILFMDRGDLDLAKKRYEASLAIYEKLAPGSLDVANILFNLGRLADDRGDLDLAQKLYEAALDILEKLAPNSLRMAGILNNLGILFMDRGDLDLAQKRHEAALAIKEKLAPGSLGVADSLINLGIVARNRGDLDLAQKLYEAAHAIYEKLVPGSLHMAASLTNLGVVASDRGDLDLAQKLYEAALDIREKLAPNSLKIASILNGLGIVAWRRGDLDLAQKRYEAAIAIQEKLEPGSTSVTMYLKNLQYVARARKNETDLWDIQQRLLEIVTKLIETRGPSQGGELGSLGSRGTDTLRRLGICADPTTFYPYLPALRGAGLTLQTRFRAAQRLAESDADVLSAVSAVQVATKRETDWVTTPRQKEMDEKAWNDYRVELRAKHKSAELKLTALLKEKDSRLGQDTLRVGLMQVQHGLPDRHVLVEFLRIYSWDDKKSDFGANEYGVYLVSKDGPVRFMRLGPADQIDALVKAWQEQVSFATDIEAGEVTLKSTEKELRSIGRKLYDKLIKPLGKLPENLLIAPDSTLHGLSFGALVDGKGKYLVESKVMSVVGSGRDLVEKPIAGVPGPSAVIAGPDFGLGSAEVAAANAGVKSETSVMRSFNSNGTWDSLDGALEEGRFVAGKLRVPPIDGAKATEERLMSLVRPRVLHIATHGNFDPPTLAATDREDFRMSGMVGANLRVADNPMIRSALIMAGANNEAALRKEGLQDGWATALELSQMDLRGTELVVLSACNTAKGDVRGADGVFGLQRAFRFAGAQTLVMSLFKVPDASTLKLMEQFYGAWKPGDAPGSKLTALRGAQLAMLKDPKTRHPRNWSAFVLMGNR